MTFESISELVIMKGFLTVLTITLFMVFCLSNGANAQKSMDSLIVKLERISERKHFPGVMISIVKADTTLFAGGIGYANLENEELVNDQHLFRLGSISKTFTAMGLMHLAEQSRIDLDVPISQISADIPYTNKWSPTHPISTFHLLEHTAGFDDLHMHALYDDVNETQPVVRTVVDVHAKSLKARWRPGERYSYSNPGYVVAGFLIEHVSNEPFNTYIKDNLLRPIGMLTSDFYFKPDPDLSFATPYKRFGKEHLEIDFASIQGGPSGDFCSNAMEMAKFLRFMLKQQTEDSLQPISQESLKRMETPMTSIAAKAGNQHGYGLGIVNLWMNGFVFKGHDGGIDGFSSVYLYSREADLGLAISANQRGDVYALARAILKHFLGKPDPSKPGNVTETTQIQQAVINEYSGYYHFKNPRNQWLSFLTSATDGNHLSFVDNHLIIKSFFGMPLDTLLHKNGQYYLHGRSVPFAALLKNESGNLVAWINQDYAQKESHYLRKIWVAVMILTATLSFIFIFVGFIWWLIQVFGKQKKSRLSRFFLWLASVCLFLFALSIPSTIQIYDRPATVNFGSITAFILSIVFFIATLIGVLLCLKLKNESTYAKLYLRVTAMSLLFWGGLLLYQGMIGFRLWAY